MTNIEIATIIRKLENEEMQYGKYGNNSVAPYKRIVEDGMEYTLVGAENENRFLYMGPEGATVARLKEDRREDSLVINGKAAIWAGLIANDIKSAEDFFKCCV